MKRVLLIAICATSGLAIVAAGIFLLRGGIPTNHSGPLHPIDAVSGSMHCMTSTVTTCSATITNVSSSRDPLSWTLKQVTPDHGRVSPSTGALQPGESSEIQI